MSNLNESGLNPAAQGKAAVMKQIPDDAAVRAESPLHHIDLPSMAGKQKDGGIYLKELAFVGHLSLRCDQKNAEQLSTVKEILGLELPLQPLTSNTNDQVQIRWMSPDEWLITVPGDRTFEIEGLFREKMTGHYSLVNGSGGQTILEVRGPSVVDLLKKCVPVDLHSSEFPGGKVVSTTFAKAGAVIRRLDEQSFELVIRRSFADYIWLWIQDASQEFGLVIEQ
ncbi:sarcosine oxidase subunit gamma [Endozoicomonas sp. OPT23]|uniref:sarcosine oxidase subunit gamma n=1 Tax=Endozoicomonas sp. OPT23 TaxID=2072845 RepID=UPI00129BCD9E|nr:sarcosine oxidase subunit gamma family protein [Endozoicomonas sp. OPT23]MRI33167.1 sarcosine oxidase subunit gamma [Endozoicomonas sp. OPT23]